MSEENQQAEDNGIVSPFDKDGGAGGSAPVEPQVAPEAVEAGTVSAEADKVEVAEVDEAPAEEVAPEATPASKDYSKYAAMAEAPTVNEHRKFDYVAVSGEVKTEVITTEAGDVEKRLPATAFKLHLTKERDEQGNSPSEELALPLTVVPIKYRMVMEQRAGSKGEVLVLKSSEFNGKTSDLVTVSRFGPKDEKGNQKVVETVGPITVQEARKRFVDTEGKMALRDKAHLYSLVNGELVRFVVKGTGLWEMESELHKGKTAESQSKYPFLSRYLSEFAANDPSFLHEMEVNAAYRDHGSIKYYRPTFTKGARISAETEDIVIEHLEDLFKYFGEMDEATKAYVATAPTEEVVATDAPAEASQDGGEY